VNSTIDLEAGAVNCFSHDTIAPQVVTRFAPLIPLLATLAALSRHVGLMCLLIGSLERLPGHLMGYGAYLQGGIDR
jgi:hypothetical protein